MRSRWAIIWFVLAALVTVGAPALAADAEDVATVVADTGVYVEVGATADSAQVGRLVSSVRAEGERVSYVALADEPVAGATTFADAIYDRLGEGVVVVVAPLSVGWSGATEVFTDVELDAALDASLDGQTDGEVLELFTATLLGTAPAASAPEPVSTSSGGGGGAWIWLLVIAVGIGLFVFWRSRRNTNKGPRLDPRLAEAKQQVQSQIDAVANDIIDMEDEVRLADNQQADDYYEQAGLTYGDVTDAFGAANTPEALLDLSNKLDVAIWQLDSAEAVLDGKPAPPRPEPKRLPTSEPAAPAGGPQSAPGTTSSLPPRPDYSRRPTRRSSPTGGGLLEILIGVAGSMMAGTARGGGMLGGLGGSARSSRGTRVSTPRFPQVPTRSGRGSSPVPGPSRSSDSSSSSRSSRSSSSRAGKTGRGRGGGQRRRG